MDAWLGSTAADLGRGIAAGAIDPRDLAEAFLAAIAAHPKAEAIYARTAAPDRARAEAAAAADRARAGLRRGPLDGVPIAWKDLVDSAGVATEAGSGLLRGRIPESDAAVLATATRAGLVCLGKTHMTELAFSGLGVNPVTATPPNRHDPDAAPGGSSSGTAAAIALDLAPAAIGSDTGGSVRVPAAWNDLVGLKTSHGLLPLDGIVPLCPRFDTLGPLGRSVEDVALLLAALGGAPAPDLTAPPTTLSLFVLDDPAIGPNREAPQAAFEATLDRLAAAGVRLERGPLPGAGAALPLAPCLFTGEAYGTWRAAIEAEPDRMFAAVRDRFRLGAAFSAADYVDAWRQLDGHRAAFAAATASYDAVLMPTTANLPPNVPRLLAEPEFFIAENLLTLRNTRIANLMDLCALTLPTGTPHCGVMVMAPPRAEARLLRAGAALERILA